MGLQLNGSLMYLKHRDVRGKYVVLTVDYEQAQLFVHWEDRCILALEDGM